MTFGLLAPFLYLVPKGERHVSVLFMSRASIMIFHFMNLMCLPSYVSVLCEPCDLGLMWCWLMSRALDLIVILCYLVLAICASCSHNQKLLSSIVMTKSL